MAEYFGAGEDSIYLSGMAAGAATKKGVIGYVVAVRDPRGASGTRTRSRSARRPTHPGAKVKLVWTNSWFDPAKEKKAAQSLHAAGADVIGQNVDSPAAGQYAESEGMPWVGYDSNAQKFAPKSWLTAAVYDWGPYYLKRVQAAMDGTWKTGFYYGSIKDGFTSSRRSGPASSAKTKAAIKAKELQSEERLVLRVRGPAVRPERQAARHEGQAADRDAALRHGLARQGRRGQRRRARTRIRGGARAARQPPPPPMPAVALRGITKRFPAVVANDGVDFEAAEGEVHALLGENGAGKSTLSNILTGLYRPDEGEILLYGEPVEFHSPRDALDAGICMVHQHFRLVPPFTVAENVDPRRPPRRGQEVPRPPAPHRAPRAPSWASATGIAVDPRARIWQLSLGEQQRVEILKALYREARILILDEPTAVLTPQEADSLFETLRDDGGRGADGDLHLAQAARGEGRLGQRDGAARRQDGRHGRRPPTRRRTRWPR